MNNLSVWLGFFAGIATGLLLLLLIAAVVSLTGTKLQKSNVQFYLPSDGLQVGVATDISIKDRVATFTFEGKKYTISTDKVVFWEEIKE